MLDGSCLVYTCHEVIDLRHMRRLGLHVWSKSQASLASKAEFTGAHLDAPADFRRAGGRRSARVSASRTVIGRDARPHVKTSRLLRCWFGVGIAQIATCRRSLAVLPNEGHSGRSWTGPLCVV